MVHAAIKGGFWVKMMMTVTDEQAKKLSVSAVNKAERVGRLYKWFRKAIRGTICKLALRYYHILTEFTLRYVNVT